MIIRLLLILCLVGFLPGILFSQTSERTAGIDEVLIDAKLIRGQFGYTQMKLTNADTFSSRIADAVNFKAEFQILSNLFGYYNHFVIYDALYVETLFGKMRNVPTKHGTDVESKFSYLFRTGYDIYAGYRNHRIGLLAGIRPRWMATSIGDLSVMGSSLGYFLSTMPYAVKAEYKPMYHDEFRILLTAWNNFNSLKKNNGFRVEVPFIPSARWWVYMEYESYKSPANYVFGIKANNADYNLFSLGVRVGSMY